MKTKIYYFNLDKYVISIIFLSLLSLSYNNYIVMPFKNSRSFSYLPKDETTEKINEYLIEADITINMKVGVTPQIVPMSLSLWNKYVYITSNALEIGVYDKDKSSSFNTRNEEPLGDQNYYRKGLYCNETFIFDSDKNIKNENTSFILTTQMEYPTEYRKGLIGFQITTYRQEETLINQLKNKDIIDNYYHFIEFEKEDEGIFVIGSSPHEYNSKKYSYNEFRQVNAREISQSWELTMTNIRYGNTKFDDKIFDLDYRFGMISVGINMKHQYYNDFFEKRIKSGVCKETLFNNYYIYSCINDDKKVKFKELKDFHFYNFGLEYDFIFTYKDLFITYNDRKYFVITYKLNSLTTIFGIPFFRKYTIVFNPDNKQIGHYIKENKEDEKNKNYKTVIILITIIVILVIILISLGFALFKLLERKKRKNELDDNYDYVPEEKNSIGIE